jgi:methyltransferase (TIGR00027 family)
LKFKLINLALLPVTLAGYGIWVGTLLLEARRRGVSITAQSPLFSRWMQHHLGVRQDEAAARLLPALPGVPALGLSLVTAPLLLGHRMTGYVPPAFRYHPYHGNSPVGYKTARVFLFDAALERYRPRVDQLVLLGAGFDTRAWRSPRLPTFEVDQPRTQAVKRDALRRAGVDMSGVIFVSADLTEQDWMDRLARAGFDPGRPTFFLWEGVTMYLEREAVESTLRCLARTARGSVVAFDYLSPLALESRSRYMRFARAATVAVGEPLRSALDRPGELLASCGLKPLEVVEFGGWGGFTVAGN